jgi:hypothetical protein
MFKVNTPSRDTIPLKSISGLIGTSGTVTQSSENVEISAIGKIFNCHGKTGKFSFLIKKK